MGGVCVLKLELLSPQRSTSHIQTRGKKCHRAWERTFEVRGYRELCLCHGQVSLCLFISR